MHVFMSKPGMALFMSLALIVALAAAPAMAQKEHEIAGQMSMAQTSRQEIDIGDTNAHVISLTEYQGTNESTGQVKFMDGAQAVNMAFGDLVQGIGPHQGYVKLVQGDDVVFCKWEGMVTTTVPEEGIPITAFEGTFSYIKGKGQFENIQGNGTYKGMFTSKTEFTVEWEAAYSIAE